MSSWNLCTSGQAIQKAGVNANADIIISGQALALWSQESEAALSAITRKDWVADYPSVKTNFKQVLADAVSDMIALKIIGYDMSGYTSRLEVQTLLDLIRDNLMRNLDALKDQKNQEKM